MEKKPKMQKEPKMEGWAGAWPKLAFQFSHAFVLLFLGNNNLFAANANALPPNVLSPNVNVLPPNVLSPNVECASSAQFQCPIA